MARVGQGLSIVVGALLLFEACGDRTQGFGQDFEHRYNIDGGSFEEGSDGGGLAGSGGRRGGTGGRRATGGRPATGGYYGPGGRYPGRGGARATGGYPGYGGYYPGYGGRYPGYGGYPGGMFGSGGYYPGYGGYPSYGGYPYCSYPYCGSCSTCVEQCICYGSDKDVCYNECYGAGGAAGAPSCDPSFCPTSTIPNVGLQLGACCQNDQCGVELDLIASVLPVVGGCQLRNQPGEYGDGCPSLPSPVGGSLLGCCRYDGTCGVDLSTVGVGCAARTGPVQACTHGGGTGGFGGFGGIGGGFGPGGSISTGGVRTTGGTSGAGGLASTGGSVAVDQCVNQARGDCEVCACKSCFADIAPCFQDVGCPAILQCANLTGCSGVNCYSASTCQSVIDQYGGPFGSSVNVALPLFQCLQSAGCPCGFAQ